MRDEKNIKWGIIGLGKIATKFATDLQDVPHCSLYGVASRSQEKANSFAKQFDAQVAYGSYEELAADPEVDALYIATPHSLHKSCSLLGIQHQKAVLCEKPLAMNLNQVEEMLAAAHNHKVLLMEALWTFFLPHYQFVLEQLNSKKYGALLKIEADFGFRPVVNFDSRVFNKSLGGGSLMDIGIYPIFVALTTLGKPQDIEARAEFFDNGVDAACQMVFNYRNGVKAFLKSTLLEETRTEAIFHCEHGHIKIHSRFHEPSQVTTVYHGVEKVHDFGYSSIGYSYEIDHFNHLLRHEKLESPLMSHDFSRNLMSLLDEVRYLIGLNYE